MNDIGNNLKRIRLLKKMSLKEAGDILNMSAMAVSKYEKGSIIPNSKKVIEFANAYNVSTLEILKVYNPVELKFTSFRKKKRLSGKNFELLKQVINEKVSKYFEVKSLEEYEEDFISMIKFNCNNLNDAEQAALEFRNFIGISNRQPIIDLISILENLGILFVQIKNVNNLFDDFDGLSEMVNGVPVIILNENINDGARQRFTIAHELGHLLLNITDEEYEEKFCNRFASGLLMPKEAVIKEFGSKRGNISFFELKAFKEEYRVSYAAIIYRLKDLNIISEYLYKNLNIFINSKIGKNDPNPINVEKSNQFKKSVYRLEANNIISENKAVELLGITLDEFRNENNNY